MTEVTVVIEVTVVTVAAVVTVVAEVTVVLVVTVVTEEFFFFLTNTTFTKSAYWADSVIELPCPSVCIFAPSGAVF